MRVPSWIAPVTVAALLIAGCTGTRNDSNNSSLPSQPPSSAPATLGAPTEEPTADPTPTPAATSSSATPAPARTRSKDPNLPIIVPVNTVALTCIMPARLPKLADTSANEYPKIVFNAMCGAEKRGGHSGSYRFGQVGMGEGVECGKEYVIDGNETTGIAWWCPQHKLLISSPASVLEHGSERQKLLRELTIAYAFAYVDTHDKNAYTLDQVACVIGRTILNLRVYKMLSTGNANSLMDNFTSLLESAKATSLSASLRNGYNDTGQC